MAIRRYKKISELDALTSASLSTYVAGVDNGETVKITLDILASGVRDTINTLDNIRLTNLENYTASYSASGNVPAGTISSSAQITALGFISSSQTIDTGSFVTTSSFQSFSSSVHTELLAATNEQSFNGLISGSEQVLGGSGVYSSSAQIDGFETTGRGILSGSILYTSLTDIPEGIVSGSDQLTSSLNELYVFSGSVQNVILPDGLISSSTQIELLGFVTASQNVYVTTQSFYEFTQSFYQFTGSVNGTFVSTSSFNDYTASISTGSLVDRLNSLEGNTGSYETTGRNILSGSILDLLPNGVISGSEQVLGGSGVWSGSVQLPSGVVSGSSQVLGGSGVYSSSAQIDGFETTGRGILSGSVSYTNLTNIPSGIVSGSSQITSLLPAGTLSGSAQITAFGFVSGSYETTGRGIISSSAQIDGLGYITTASFNTYTASISTASLVTSITNLNSATSSYLTSLNGAISSSSQLTSSYDTRYTLSGSVALGTISSSAQISAFGFISTSTDLTLLNQFSSSQYISNSYFATTGSNSFFGNQFISGNLIPTTDGVSYTSSFSLGSPTNAWKDIYVSTGSIHFIDSAGQVSDVISAKGNGLRIGNLNVDNGITGSLRYEYLVNTPTLISGASQITELGYTTTSSFNSFTQSYKTDSSSFDSRITSINNIASQGVPTGTISGSSQITALGFISSSTTPAGTISSSTQITSFGFVSGSYETTDRGIVSGSSQITPLLPTGVVSGSAQTIANLPAGTISSSTQIAGLGYAITGSNIFTANQTIQGNLIVTGSLTAQTLIFSSSVYYTTASYSSGSTIFGNSIDDTHQYTGSVSITGSLTASLHTGYTWVGNGNNISTEFPTASLLSTASFNSFTSSQFNTLSSSVATVQTNLNSLTASLGVTSTPFNYTSVVNPTNYVLVSYPTASFNGGSMDIIVSRPSDSTAVSNFCLIASFGANGSIASKGSENSGAGAPNPSFTLALSGSVMNIRISVSAGTYNIKGVARLF